MRNLSTSLCLEASLGFLLVGGRTSLKEVLWFVSAGARIVQGRVQFMSSASLLRSACLGRHCLEVCLNILQSCLLLKSLFEGITAHEALEKLRFMLAAIGVEKAELYRSHDIRRGHALDLQCAGGDCVL